MNGDQGLCSFRDGSLDQTEINQARVGVYINKNRGGTNQLIPLLLQKTE